MGMSNRHAKELAKMRREQKPIEFYARPDGLPAPFESTCGFVKGIAKNHLEFPSGSGGSLKGRTMPLPIGQEVFTDNPVSQPYKPVQSPPVFINRLPAKGRGSRRQP